MIKRLFQLALFSNALVLLMLIRAQATGEPPTQQTFGDNSGSPLAKCLPPDIKLSDIVDAPAMGHASGQPAGSHAITVEQKLNGLNATCNSDNKLADANGRQIVFYHLIGCWGNPPENYQEILQKQRDEINKLKQQYTVIEMTCNPSGIPIS